MVSRIAENRQYEYISIEHLGEVQNGKEDTTSEKVKAWSGALENYTLKEKGGQTELLIDMDTAPEYIEMMERMWSPALTRLKELAEGR